MSTWYMYLHQFTAIQNSGRFRGGGRGMVHLAMMLAGRTQFIVNVLICYTLPHLARHTASFNNDIWKYFFKCFVSS